MDAVEEIKQRLSIEDVVGEYVELKRAGRNWKGLSPFASERTPSFVVSPEKQIWHDFSSGKGGNIFSFVMEMEGLDFRGALELLARKAGIDLEQFRGVNGGGGRGKEKERLYAILELATKFYQVQFSKHQIALEYVFKKRCFNKEAALEWRLGYAPNTGTALADFLLSKKFTAQEIKDAGLSAQRYRGVGDMFRGRLMVPLCDAQGRVIGFTARILADDPNAPKYINTPQTLLYDKSRHVFGLHLAKEAMRRSGFVVVTEGQLDVVSSHQAGVRQVVATAGTALTEPHLKALNRFTGDIRLSFDADKAGINATERAIPIASKANVSLSIITIPSGKDPDELIKQDPKLWVSVISKPQYALDWLMDRYQVELDTSSAQGKRTFSDVLLAVIRGLNDPVEQDHYLDKVATVLGVSKSAMRAKLYQRSAPEKPKLKRPVTTTVPQSVLVKATAEYRKLQSHLLSLTLLQPKVRVVLAGLRDDMFTDQQSKDLYAFLVANPGFTGDVGQAEALRPLADYVKILGLQYEELYQTIDSQDLRSEAERLQYKLIEQYVKMQKHHIVQQLDTADEATQQELLQQAKELDDLLKNYNREG